MHSPTRTAIGCKFIPAAVLLASIATSAFAQFETAAVLGTILDAQGSAIPQARVTLENAGTGTRQNTLADANGNYQFLEVRVGRYRVVAEAVGFKKLETPPFSVEVGARQRVDARLEVGDVSETVRVESGAALVEPDSSDR